MLQLSTINIITFGIALLGAVLGLINTWCSYDRDRVKLKVIPKIAFPVGPIPDKRPRLCIDVVNLSMFPVTVSQLGFLMHGTKDRLDLVIPIIIDGGKFPRRLESRSSFTAYFEPGVENGPRFKKVKIAYAETECGELFRGKSRALRSAVKRSSLAAGV